MKATAWLAAAAVALAATPLGAQSWRGVMKNAPGELLDEEDVRLFSEASNKALDEAPDGQSVSWENPKTRHGGEITVVRSFQWQSHSCRELRFSNRAQGRQADGNLNWCKVDGKWRLVGDSQLGRN